MIGTIIFLLCGALGGNIAGALMKDSSLGTLWNSVVGIAGGGLGGVILGMLGMGAAGSDEALDVANIVSNVASGGVGGGVVLAVVGLMRSAMAK